MNKVMMTGLVMAAMACGVQAATVYDKDGTKVDLKGDIQIQLRQKPGEDQDMYMDYDDLQASFEVKHDTESGVQAFGTLKMDWKGQAGGDAKAAVDEAFAGLKIEMVSFLLGRLDYGSDKFEVDRAIEIGDAIYAMPKSKGSESLQVVLDFDYVKAMISHDLEVKGNDSVSEIYLVTNPKKTFGLQAGVIYQSYDTAVVKADEEAGIEAKKSETIDTVGVRAIYTVGKVALGADYSTNDDLSVLNASVGFPIVDKTSGSIGYTMESPDEGDDVGTWYANVKHKVAKNATVFAEIGNTDKDDSDMGYLAGMQVKF